METPIARFARWWSVVSAPREEPPLLPTECVICGAAVAPDSHTCGSIDCEEAFDEWAAKQW